MFIICPKCSAKYRLPDDIDLKEGQKLKCSACGLVFEKGQEAPFVLERPESSVPDQEISTEESKPQNNPPPEWTAPEYVSGGQSGAEPAVSDDEVFRTPMFDRAIAAGNREAAGLNMSPASFGRSGDIIPEAFVPVESSSPKTSKKSGLVLVVIYLVAIIGFCCAAWHYRDMLMPAFYSFMPRPTNERAIRPVVRENVPATKKDSKPVETSAVVQLEKKKSPDEAIPVKGEAVVSDKSERGMEEVVKTVPVETIVIEPVALPAEPVPVNPAEAGAVVGAAVSAQPVIDRAVDVSDKSGAVQKREDTVDSTQAEPQSAFDAEPLFDMVAEPVPTASENELSIQDVHFRIVPDEGAGEQLLVEGTLRNTASDSRSIPVLTATVWSGNSQILGQKKVHVTQEQIGAGQIVSFYTSFTPAPVGASHVDVTF